MLVLPPNHHLFPYLDSSPPAPHRVDQHQQFLSLSHLARLPIICVSLYFHFFTWKVSCLEISSCNRPTWAPSNSIWTSLRKPPSLQIFMNTYSPHTHAKQQILEFPIVQVFPPITWCKQSAKAFPHLQFCQFCQCHQSAQSRPLPSQIPANSKSRNCNARNMISWSFACVLGCPKKTLLSRSLCAA